MADDTPTVLLVDDEEDVVKMYALALGEEYEIRTAHSGEQALEEADETVDIVLLDRRMPGLSGGEILERLRQRRLDVRVAMVTAVDPDFDIAEMDFDAYLTKPVGDSELRGVVRELRAISSYDEQTKELYSVAEKKATLEAEKSKRELAASEEYATLQERASELESRAADRMDEMDVDTFERVVSGLPDDDVEQN